MSHNASESIDRQQQLDEILADLMRAIDAGSSVDANQWVASHPDFALELREFFQQQQRVESLVRPLRQAAVHALHIRCPNCHNPMELLEEIPVEEISCPSCGSSFSLVGEATPASFPCGVRELGHFKILDCVGVGQFGSVWKARDTKLDRTVAVKIPRNGRLDVTQTELFLRDARAAAQLQHPNIVSVHEVGRQDETIYIVSDFIQGAALSEWSATKRLTPRESAELCVKIARALHHAHQAGVVHRDLKPGNIMMDADGEPHIVDFGLAKREAAEMTMTVEGQILGTPAYMPPEQARGESHAVDRRADIYSLGVILFELLTGELPFRGDKQMLIVQILNDDPPNPRKLNNGVPRDLETICVKCLAKAPIKRYENAQHLADDLQRFLCGQTILARPVGHWERTQRWCRRNPVVATLSAATMLLLVAVAFGYLREADLRQDVEASYHDLQAEQRRSASLQQDVSSLAKNFQALQKRRAELNSSLAEGQRRLMHGEEKLHETYLKLARAAWRDDQVELADFYLDQCPVDQRNAAWHELKRQCHPQVETFEGQHCVAISGDGQLLAAGGVDNTVNVWEVRTGQLLYALSGHDGEVKAVDFSAEGQLLASGGGRQVILWDLTSGSLHQVLEGHSESVTDVDFSPDGRLASASYAAGGRAGDRGEVILWDLQTSPAAQTLNGLRYVVFNHDGKRLATGRVASTPRRRMSGMIVWDLSADDLPSHAVSIGAHSACRPAFHPRKNELAVSKGHAVEFWNIDSKRIVRRFSGEVQVGCLAYNADGNRLAYTGTTNAFSLRPDTFRTVVWNLITGEKERILPWYSSVVVGAAFSSDGRQLVTADGKGIKIWDVTPPPDPTQRILNDIVELKVGQYDWPQWGGSRARINTPAGNNIPFDWDIGKGLQRVIWSEENNRWIENPDFQLAACVPENSRNIKWAVPLGTQTYGNPVVANGLIFLGTNNGAGYLKRYPPTVDLGVLLCFDEETGEFLWQHSNEKLKTGRVHDWPLQGVCSTPMVDGQRLWYVSNRGEVVCLDTEGFHDGEDDGPLTREMVRVFQISVSELLREFLPKAFEEHQVALPQQWSLGTSKVNKHWTITRYDRGRRLVEWHFDVRASGHKLFVAKFDSLHENSKSTELFSVEWPLLEVLGKPAMVSYLRQQFIDCDVPVPDAVDVQTGDEGREWSFIVPVRGTEHDCRLRLEGGTISGFLTILDEKDEADVVWKFNMMTELGVSQHNMATCSIITAGGMLFVCTSNGCDETQIRIPAPDAPSFMALDRDTGKVIWTDNSPGANIMHAQWASPSYGLFDGQPQVIFPGGDGWVYSFDPQGDGEGGSKLLWKFDGNPKTSKWSLGGRGTRNNIIAFPAIYDSLVYVVMGQDPEHGEGSGHLWCIDPKKRMDGSDVSAELAVDREGNVIPHRRMQAVDISIGERSVPNPDSAVVWHYSYQDQNHDGEIVFEEEFHRSLSIPVIKDDILYISDFSGLFHCLHAKTGKVYWTYDQMAACWGSALLVDGKVYICDEDGDVTVFRHSADPGSSLTGFQTHDGQTELIPIDARWEGNMINEIALDSSVYMTPIVANNVLYIATKNTLYAIEEIAESP